MPRRFQIGGMIACLLAGMYLGANFNGMPQFVAAQDEAFEPPSEETIKKITASYDSLRAAMEGLKQEQRYVPATKSLNPYSIMVGGLDVVADLESGRGVDPYTFAGLYAGDATDEIATHLTKDDEGRLLYKNRIVRMYPISRFKRLDGQRISLTTGRPGAAAETP